MSAFSAMPSWQPLLPKRSVFGISPNQFAQMTANAFIQSRQRLRDATATLVGLPAACPPAQATEGANHRYYFQDSVMPMTLDAPSVAENTALERRIFRPVFFHNLLTSRPVDSSQQEAAAISSSKTSRKTKYPPPDLHKSGAVVVDFQSTNDLQTMRRMSEGVLMLREWGRAALASRLGQTAAATTAMAS